MKFPPPEVIASWPKPDYENPRGQGPAGEIAVYILTGVVTVMIIIRMYTRIHTTKGFGMDDAFMLAAYVCDFLFLPLQETHVCRTNRCRLNQLFATGFTGIAILAERTVGWGVHIYDVETYKFKPGLKIVYVPLS